MNTSRLFEFPTVFSETGINILPYAQQRFAAGGMSFCFNILPYSSTLCHNLICRKGKGFEEIRIFSEYQNIFQKLLSLKRPTVHTDSWPCLYRIPVLILYIGHQSNVAGSLDRYRQRSLVLCTITGDTTGKNLAPLGNVPL